MHVFTSIHFQKPEVSVCVYVVSFPGILLSNIEDFSNCHIFPFPSFSLPKVPEFTGSPRRSPSSSTDREASYTPKSLSPTPSPIHSRTCTPSHSASSTPSPTPPPSPNLPRRGPAKKQNFDPLSVSINLPVTQPAGGVVTPKFMINGVPTSPPQEVGVSHKKKFTVESFLGSVPAASIHVS